jgi:hypothetical protein
MIWTPNGKYAQQAGNYRIAATRHGDETRYTLWELRDGKWIQIRSSDSARSLRNDARNAD